MAIKKIEISTFLSFAKDNLVLDVRSPGEYNHAHIPNAYSFPLFSDEERKVVGTSYKQESKETAIKIGLDYFGPKMRKMVEEVEGLLNNDTKKVLVHCWRGGMRSGGVAWLLDLYGFDVYQLEGGYKAYRNWAIQQYDKPYEFIILGGNTGSGKTYLLNELTKNDIQVIDLEALACHKGSALGGINQPVQPSQEMFENLLAEQLADNIVASPIWLEDESQRIGNLNIPNLIWNKMKESDLYYLIVPFEERLKFLVKEYGDLPKIEINNAILRIQKRLGGLETKNTLRYLEEENFYECFSILLKYYDKYYERGLARKEKGEVIKITAHTVDEKENAGLILKEINK